MTSPFKTPAKIRATCNNCEEEFTYNDTYGTGRLCQDCHDKLDDPKRCSYELDVNVDSVTQELHVIVSISHEESTQINIPPYRVETSDSGDGLPTHHGFIADLTVTTNNNNVLHETTWTETREHVLDKHRECKLNINSIHSVGARGQRQWNVTIPSTELFAHDEVTVSVVFPSINDEVPESNLTTQVTVPSYLISLEE